ncbi:MAG TPA: extracellular solute-binding protein, partial [Chloroflexota bacterium]|nr:extracellular solute-binding protein [Chloroflexota bacterium]
MTTTDRLAATAQQSATSQGKGRTRRQMLSTGAALVPAVALGCGAGGQAKPDPALTLSKEPVTITYWDWAGVWKDLVGQLSDSFTAKHNNVTVQWEIVPGYWDKLQVAIAGDTAPDTWRMNGPNLPSWATRGLLTDLTPLV